MRQSHTDRINKCLIQLYRYTHYFVKNFFFKFLPENWHEYDVEGHGTSQETQYTKIKQIQLRITHNKK